MSTRTDFVRLPSSRGLVLALLAVSTGTREVRAQIPVAAAAPVQFLPDESFEMWVFNKQGNAATARQRFDALLKSRIDEIDGNCRLSEEQKQKLQLMGCGDIKQIFDSFDKAKRQFNLLNNDMQKLREIRPLVEPIQMAQHSLFQDGSLFAKSLRHTLTEEQFARYKKGEPLPAPRAKAPAKGGSKP
jgi:flagellar hook-basal body complex protein FliE